MKRRTGMKSTQERVTTAMRAFSSDRFHAFAQFRDIRVFDNPGNSELP
jgi:hypothetical protein